MGQWYCDCKFFVEGFCVDVQGCCYFLVILVLCWFQVYLQCFLVIVCYSLEGCCWVSLILGSLEQFFIFYIFFCCMDYGCCCFFMVVCFIFVVYLGDGVFFVVLLLLFLFSGVLLEFLGGLCVEVLWGVNIVCQEQKLLGWFQEWVFLGVCYFKCLQLFKVF